jgi:hypothetical protein
VQDRQLSSRDLITGLCVVTKRMDTCCPWIVANNPRAPYWFDGPAHDGNERYSFATLVRASTAAPHFFDPEMFAISKDEEGLFIDGGVTPFNNPSLALFQMATFQPFGICWPTGPDKLTVTSVGTGTYRPLFSYAEEGSPSSRPPSRSSPSTGSGICRDSSRHPRQGAQAVKCARKAHRRRIIPV